MKEGKRAKQPRSYPLRLPQELKETAEREARANERTLHGELLFRLRKSYQEAA